MTGVEDNMERIFGFLGKLLGYFLLILSIFWFICAGFKLYMAATAYVYLNGLNLTAHLMGGAFYGLLCCGALAFSRWLRRNRSSSSSAAGHL
jgi:hypothetical protein